MKRSIFEQVTDCWKKHAVDACAGSLCRTVSSREFLVDVQGYNMQVSQVGKYFEGSVTIHDCSLLLVGTVGVIEFLTSCSQYLWFCAAEKVLQEFSPSALLARAHWSFLFGSAAAICSS